MSLQSILASIRSAEKELTELVEKEQEIGKSTPYVFVYEQTYSDEPGWGPNYQIIYAYDLPQAFQSFGVLLRTYGLTVRNICYGGKEDMREAMSRTHDHYNRVHREEERSRE